MNSTLAQNTGPRNHRSRVAISVSLTLLVSLNLLPTNAQSRTQRRITSVWTATSASGSIVNVISDAPVNDYEAYSRSGRFYVRVGSSDLPSARGSLLGRGFDDVQINRYGDGIIISFHLLPGTAARVNQAGNRLEIIFTIPAKSIAVNTARKDDSNRARDRRLSDMAGPAPSSATVNGSPARPRPTASPAIAQVRGDEAKRAGGSPEKKADQQSASSSEVAKPSLPDAIVAASPLPSASPIASASPGSSSAASLASSSPVSAPVANTSPATTPEVTAGTDDSNWRSRLNYWKIWAQLNWAPILIGVLVFLALIVLLLFWRAFRRLSAAGSDDNWETASEKDESPQSPSAPVSQPGTAVSAAAAGSGVNQSNNQAHSSSTSRGDKEQIQGADPDREVFEL